MLPVTASYDIPGLDNVRRGEDGSEQDAQAADDDVGNAEERILAADDGASRDDDGLCAAEAGHVEFCSGNEGQLQTLQQRDKTRREHTIPDVNLILASLHRSVVVAEGELAEVG